MHSKDYGKISEFISKNAAKDPGKIALYFYDRRYTYKELEDEVRKTARFLRSEGIKKGDRVALILGNSPEFIISYFAIGKLGAVVVPTNTFFKSAEIALNLNDCEASCLITSKSFEKTIGEVKESVPSLRNIFFYENISVTDTSDIEEEVALDDLMTILYTSGTTGAPKGAMITHKNLIENSLSFLLGTESRTDDKTLLILPMFHSFSFLACVAAPLYCGASIVIFESVHDMGKEVFKQTLVNIKPTLLLGVPQVYAAMVHMNLSKEELAYMPFRSLFAGGAPLPVEIINKFKEKFGKPVVEGYGLSEASPACCVNPVSGVQKPGTIGLPLPGIEMKVVDTEGNEVPPNTVGELCVKGDNVMKGYWGRPKETADAIKNGWLHTGDLATKDGDGYYTIVDRLKDIIIVKGMNIYPRQIEELLYQLKGVRSAAVIGIPAKDGDETVVAYIMRVEGAELEEFEVKEYLKDKVARFKMPKRVIFSNSIPINASGKILKKLLKEQYIKDYGI